MNKIAKYLLDKDLRQSELAESLGTSQGHISDLVGGRVNVSVRIAKKMAALTGKPWHSFMQVGTE